MPPRASGSGRGAERNAQSFTHTPSTVLRTSAKDIQCPSIPLPSSSCVNHNDATGHHNSALNSLSSVSSPAVSMFNSQAASSPSSSSSPAASQSSQSQEKPPRPPNPWIIYRREKLKELGKPKPGEPKIPQSQISKTISQMWRNESDEVKKKYERMAEYAKAEHARMYPNYKFAPMKKADKERLRKEEKEAKAKERAAEKEALRRSKEQARARYMPTPEGSTSSELARLPAVMDPMLYSPPISCANTPEPVHDCLPSSVSDESSPLSIGSDEHLPQPSRKGKEKEGPCQPQPLSSLTEKLPHDHSDVPFLLPSAVEDAPELFNAFDDPQPEAEFSNFDGLFGRTGSLAGTFLADESFQLDQTSGSDTLPGLGDVPASAQQDAFNPLGFNVSEPQSPFSYLYNMPDGLPSDDLLQSSRATLHGRQQEWLHQRQDLSYEAFGQSDLFSDFLVTQPQDEQPANSNTSPRVDQASLPPPSSTSLLTTPYHDDYTSSIWPVSSYLTPDIPAPKRRRFSPDSNLRSLPKSAYNDGTSVGANSGHLAPPLTRTGSEELTQLFGASRLLTNDGLSSSLSRSSGGQRPSSVSISSSFDLPPAQSSTTSRKRRHADL